MSSVRAKFNAKGMALIAVLWLVAAMSILVMGATQTVKQHIQATGQMRDVVTAQALAEGAFALALQQLVADNKREAGIQSGQFQLMGVDVAVQITPLNGWINLNGANEELLASVFTISGGWPAAQAHALAVDVVAWRDTRPEQMVDGLRNANASKRLFESVDDLMLVPGMDFDLLTKVKSVLVADLEPSRRVNPLAAPPEVLEVLAGGNLGVVEQITTGRGEGNTTVDTSGLDGKNVQTTSSNQYRLRADIPLEAGKMLRVTQDVAVGRNFSPVAPWRVLRVSRQVQAD